MSIRSPLIAFLACLIAYALLMGPFTSYMCNKPIEEKLGYVPSVQLLKPLSADLKELTGASLVMKVLMYYGGMVGKAQEGKIISEPPDLQGMSRLLHGAVQLDPYNMDAYYFAQSFLTWDAKQYVLANNLLAYGMKYRTWDWYLPFFAGFNNAFFLKNYAKAAEFYRRAGDISGDPLFKKLAGRYLQKSGQTALAIAYLSAMEKNERNPVVKKGYRIRLKAFKEVRRIELARDRFLKSGGALPVTVDKLLGQGILAPPPVDPYGGQFYLEPDGSVTTTSKFAYAGVKKNNSQNNGESNERH